MAAWPRKIPSPSRPLCSKTTAPLSQVAFSSLSSSAAAGVTDSGQVFLTVWGHVSLIQRLVGLLSGDSLILGLGMRLVLCPHRGKGQGGFLGLFQKGTNPIMGGHHPLGDLGFNTGVSEGHKLSPEPHPLERKGQSPIKSRVTGRAAMSYQGLSGSCSRTDRGLGWPGR